MADPTLFSKPATRNLNRPRRASADREKNGELEELNQDEDSAGREDRPDVGGRSGIWSSLFNRGAVSGVLNGFNTCRDDIAVALGGDQVYVASKLKPEARCYDAAMAVSTARGEVLAVGRKAAAMRGLEPQNVRAFPVLRHGVPLRPRDFGAYIRELLRQHFEARFLFRPFVLCSGNFGNAVAGRMVRDAFAQAGAREVVLCDAEIAAACGLGLKVFEPELTSVLLLERDWMGFMVISMGSCVAGVRLPFGVLHLVEDLAIQLQEKQGFAPKFDDLLKSFLAEGLPGVRKLSGWEAWGDQIEKGRPKELEIDESFVREAFSPMLLRLKYSLSNALESATREQRWTVERSPIHLAGSGVIVPGIAEMLESLFGRKLVIRQEAEWAACHGLLALLPERQLLKKLELARVRTDVLA